MSKQKFCFRYDGSDEADKALQIFNEARKNKGEYEVPAAIGCKYCSDGDWGFAQHPDYTLVPPSEFIRLMKGEEWRPKVGDPLEFKYKDDPTWFNGIYMGLSGIGDGFCVKYIGDHYYSTKHIRPIRKSLREELIEWAKKYESVLEAMPELLAIIDRHEKERGVEG